jgi:hypothetical protein
VEGQVQRVCAFKRLFEFLKKIFDGFLLMVDGVHQLKSDPHR